MEFPTWSTLDCLKAHIINQVHDVTSIILLLPIFNDKFNFLVSQKVCITYFSHSAIVLSEYSMVSTFKQIQLLLTLLPPNYHCCASSFLFFYLFIKHSILKSDTISTKNPKQILNPYIFHLKKLTKSQIFSLHASWECPHLASFQSLITQKLTVTQNLLDFPGGLRLKRKIYYNQLMPPT